MSSYSFFFRNLFTSLFSKNPYRATKFNSLRSGSDIYPYGIRTEQPNIDQLLREEKGEVFLVQQADIVDPTPHLCKLNSATYITVEPNRQAFSLAQGCIFGEDGIVYDTRTRSAIAETVEHWNLPIHQNPSLALPRFPQAIHLSGITCHIASYGGQTFYHFLLEILPKIYFLQDILPFCQRIIVSRYGEVWKQKWLEFVGVKNEVLWLNSLDHYCCDQLILTNRLVRHFEPNPWAINALRQLVKSDLYCSDHPVKFVWASRRSYPLRHITWEQSLTSQLNEIEEVDFGMLDPEQVVKLCGKIKAFVGFHGAAFSNLVFCPPGCRVVEILVSDQEMWYYRLSTLCGHTHTCIRIDEASIDLDKLIHQINALIH